MEKKILIVEDDISFGKLLQGWFTRNNFDATLCSSVSQAQDTFGKQSFQLVLTDLRLPDGDGILLLTWIKEQPSSPPVIIMTGYAEVPTAVAAMKLGAFDYLEKPMNPSILKEKIEQALSAVPPGNKKTPVPAQKIFTSHPPVVYGDSEAAQRLHDHIRLVAPTRMSVLILGESGTGKEYAARLIHEQSPRTHAPFIAVDCGSLSRELAPSELFGHIKGSFTSAIADKKGVFEVAQGGTVFLDEVGNLSYEVQIQLLRALQERKIRPIGSASDIEVDVRILAATNEDLEQAIRNGKFREDLYHRLNEFSVLVAPLRERKEDIPLFARHFLEEANAELGKSIRDFSTPALKILEQQSWKGNLRELRNVIRRAALFTNTEEIKPQDLPAPTTNKEEPVSPLRPQNEKEQIEKAIAQAGGNKSLAAKLLRIDRKTLYNKMHQYGIEI